MGGNKPATATAWKSTTVDTRPLVQQDTDADLFNVLRRLAKKYEEKLSKVASKLAEYTDVPPVTDFGKRRQRNLVKAAQYYNASAQSVRNLIPEPEEPIILGAPADILADVHGA